MIVCNKKLYYNLMHFQKFLEKNLMKRIIGIIFISLILFSCAPGGGKYNQSKKAGFFDGIWHGWIAPVTLVWGLFDNKIRVYEVNNTGWWYDFGFYIAIVGGFGGFALTRKKKD